MNHALPLSIVFVPALACAAQRPPEAHVIDARDAVAVRSDPPPAVEAPDPFPAGAGVDFVKDDLEDALRQNDHRAPYEERLARVRAYLGKDGDEITGGVAFRGVGTGVKSSPALPVVAPFDCFELAILQHDAYARVVRVDRRLCGLPYGTGRGPSVTLRRMQRVAEDMKHLAAGEGEGMARVRFGEPDDPKGVRWFGIGPRDERAPITCHVLSFVDGRPRIAKRELAACEIAWPPPANAFTRDESIVPRRASEAADKCLASCTTSDVCFVDRVTTAGARIEQRGDDLLAIEPDGRPARIDVSATCRPMPPSCVQAPTTSCLLPQIAPPQRPRCTTDTEDATSSTLNRAPNGIWTLTCNMKKKRATP